jgi:hypothetical protein
MKILSMERLPEEDLHLSDRLRFQAHDAAPWRGGVSRSLL